MDSLEESDSDHSNLPEDEESKVTKVHELLGSGNVKDRLPTIPDVNITSVTDVKAHLETVLQTSEDLNKCIEQIKSGTFKIHDSCIKFSKTGKKKILKNINKWTMTNTNSGPKAENLFLKKLRGPLSQLIVKHNLISKEEKTEKKTELNSDLKVGICNTEGPAVQEDSDLKRLKDQQLHAQMTALKSSSSKKKKKRSKKK